MPSRLVNRYAVYVRLEESGVVQRTIARDPSLLMAVESCISAYRTTGHLGYLIEDGRRHREFLLDRKVLLQVLFLKAHDEALYFQILNRLDRAGNQDELESFLAAHASL